VVVIGSVKVVACKFCQMGCVEGGRGNRSGVSFPKFGGNGGGCDGVGVFFLGVGTSGMGERTVLVCGVMKS
jgi:hypothetical protein